MTTWMTLQVWRVMLIRVQRWFHVTAIATRVAIDALYLIHASMWEQLVAVLCVV